MATLTLDIPDALVPDLLSAIAPRMIDSETPALVVVANKVIAGTATTGPERTALAQGWIKRTAKAALVDYRAQQAALRMRADMTDAAVSW